jgi:hypothetical protein
MTDLPDAFLSPQPNRPGARRSKIANIRLQTSASLADLAGKPPETGTVIVARRT